MAIQTMVLDPNATPDTGDQIVTKINAASTAITRASSVSAAARPIAATEVTSSMLAAGVAKANLDSMTDTARGYVKTAPVTGQCRIISIQRDSAGKQEAKYDDVPV
jgi:hypothetical protein